MDEKRQEIFKWGIVIILVVLIYRYANKQDLIQQMRDNLPPQEAAIMMGMVVGDKSNFEKEFYEKLKETGLVHLVVVSGSNVLLLSSILIEGIAPYLGRKKTILGVLIIIWSYAKMVGGEAPVIRAAIFVSIFYWAQILGRKFDVARGLILTVAIMLLANWRVVESVSFWLSLAAFGGVLTNRAKNQKDRLKIKKNKDRLWNLVKDNFLATLWISWWTVPILGLVFGSVSMVAPVTNALVLVVVEWVSLVGVAGIVWGKLMWLAYPALKYMVWLVEGVGGASWISMEVNFNWWMVAGWYLVLSYFLVRNKNRFKY